MDEHLEMCPIFSPAVVTRPWTCCEHLQIFFSDVVMARCHRFFFFFLDDEVLQKSQIFFR